jgi:hypothetical protein
MPITTTPSGGPQGEFSTYTPIYSQTLSSATGSITFSNIPTTFTDLVLVSNVIGIGNLGSGAISVRFNSDTATNYSGTYLMGNGSSATSSRASNDNRMIVASPTLNLGNNPFVNILQIQNYSNTTANKTVLSRSSIAATQVAAVVGLYRSTSPITSINYESYNGQTMSIGSTFTLYGIKAAAPAPKATGGDLVYTDNTYWYHVFNNSGVLDVKTAMSVDYLVVAGGGGGGATISTASGGGGGGAGGYRTSISGTPLSLIPIAYTVMVGGGGAGQSTLNRGSTGSDSVFSTITSSGGGGGAAIGGSSYSYPVGGENGVAGGSGGGASFNFTTSVAGTGGAGNTPSTSPSQGNTGGIGVGSGPNYGAGGGGGSGGNGGNGTSTVGGAGGVGTANSISGSSVTYAGGGGGATHNGGTGGTGGTNAGNGGTGLSNNSTAGIANRGGGGGGNNQGSTSSSGGSGIVVVRYPV